MKVAQSCPSLCDPMNYTVHGILQARILEWVAFLFSRRSSQPRDWTQVSRIAGGFFTSWATREALVLKLWPGWQSPGKTGWNSRFPGTGAIWIQWKSGLGPRDLYFNKLTSTFWSPWSLSNQNMLTAKIVNNRILHSIRLGRCLCRFAIMQIYSPYKYQSGSFIFCFSWRSFLEIASSVYLLVSQILISESLNSCFVNKGESVLVCVCACIHASFTVGSVGGVRHYSSVRKLSFQTKPTKGTFFLLWYSYGDPIMPTELKSYFY